MSFHKELKAILEIEREGKVRLEQVREEGARLLEQARQEGQTLLRGGEERLSRERHELLAVTDAEIGRLVDGIRQRNRLELDRLRALADSNREATARHILAWLWGEG